MDRLAYKMRCRIIQYQKIIQLNYPSSFSMIDQSKLTAATLCPVCEISHPELYQVSNCSHRFCLQCALSYISSQANHFSNARCLQQACGQPLNKQLPIYSKIDEQTAKKLRQFETYQFLQKNTNYRSCKKTDCTGVFLITEKKCQICQTMHCKNCAELAHKGKCVETRDQREMMQLHYRRCPTCRVWVQKSEGCQYINCKCGTEFCYTCGNLFANDPCRMKQIWMGQAEMREMMSQMAFKCPKSILQVFLWPLRWLLLIVLTAILLPLVFGLLVVVGLLTIVVVSLAFPFAMCQSISQIKSDGCRYFTCCLFALGYPFIACFAVIVMLSMLLAYPFCRNCNHHGFYNGLDLIMFKAASLYLNMTRCILTPTASEVPTAPQ